jgi:CO/xanthine dehydrogenase Mo-binding subunit
MALNMAMQAGQAGGFELKDAWRPQAMAAGATAVGAGRLQRILASMQASVITAGSKDEAATTWSICWRRSTAPTRQRTSRSRGST